MSDEIKEHHILKLILILRFACATLDVAYLIQGDVQVNGDSQENMSLSVTRGTEANIILFMLSSTHPRHKPDGRPGHFATSTSAIVAVG
jgi:hypothetical protein